MEHPSGPLDMTPRRSGRSRAFLAVLFVLLAIVAIAIGLFVLPRTWRLAGQALRILVQAAPAHVDVAEVKAGLESIDGVTEVHDVHVWTLTSGMEVGSAHLCVNARCDPATVLNQARELLATRHGLSHFTLQVDPPDARAGCPQLSW